MKKILIIIFLTILSVSCEKISPEVNMNEKNINNENKLIIKNNNEEINDESINSCWITMCSFKKDLIKKKQENILNLPNLEKYEKILSNLLKQYPTKNQILKSKDFVRFVWEINKDFFWCELNIYECKWNNPYWKDESNYLFYIFIPYLVTQNNLVEKWWKNSDIETFIQAIKRKDFKSTLEKDVIIDEYKKNLLKKINNIDIEKIDKAKLQKDNKYFEEIILNNFNWLHNNIIKEIYEIKIDWEEEWQLEEIVNFTVWEFYKLLQKLWFDENDFKNKIIEINSYETDKDIIYSIIENIHNKILKMEKWKFNFPNDRYFKKN